MRFRDWPIAIRIWSAIGVTMASFSAAAAVDLWTGCGPWWVGASLAGAGLIATASANLSSRTESQAASLQQASASMEDLTSTVKRNADQARSVNQLVGSAAEVATRGGSVVAEVVRTMSQINDSAGRIV